MQQKPLESSPSGTFVSLIDFKAHLIILLSGTYSETSFERREDTSESSFLDFTEHIKDTSLPQGRRLKKLPGNLRKNHNTIDLFLANDLTYFLSEPCSPC